MRTVYTLLLALGLAACGAPENVAVQEPTPEPEPDPEPQHPCDQAVEAQARAGDPWTPQDLEACYTGCDQGDTRGFSDGRQACITDDTYCPSCRTEAGDTPQLIGFSACYQSAYEEGYSQEGCLKG